MARILQCSHLLGLLERKCKDAHCRKLDCLSLVLKQETHKRFKNRANTLGLVVLHLVRVENEFDLPKDLDLLQYRCIV